MRDKMVEDAEKKAIVEMEADSALAKESDTAKKTTSSHKRTMEIIEGKEDKPDSVTQNENEATEEKTDEAVDVTHVLDALSKMYDKIREEENKMPLIYTKIYEIMSSIDGVKKKGKVAFGQTNYSYQTAEDLVKAIKPKLVEAKVIVFPIEATRAQNASDSPSDTVLIEIKVTYRFLAIEDGSYIDVPVLSAGADKGDKAVYKANTGAYKYAIKQTFAIEAGEDDVDKDASDLHPIKPQALKTANGTYKGEDYTRMNGISQKSGTPYVRWEPINKPKTGVPQIFWSDQQFTTAGGVVKATAVAPTPTPTPGVKQVSTNDLPF